MMFTLPAKARSIFLRPFAASVIAMMAVVGSVSTANAQYFSLSSDNVAHVVLEADDLDSVLLDRNTPFAVPTIHDTIDLVYHEPMPDSVMPRSAVVIGTVTIQAEEAQDIVEMLEETARKHGANWIVSFTEPRLRKTAAGDRYYRSSAQLLRVLDDAMIPESALAYSYYRESQFKDFAQVESWYDTYGRHLGANDVHQREQEMDEDEVEP